MTRLTTLTLLTFLTLMSAPVQAAYRDTVLGTPGLISYWQLNEIAGTSASDSKGVNPGTHLTGAYPGMFRLISTGYSAYYDGAGGYTAVSSSSALNPTNAISLEAWVRPDTLPSSSTIIRKDSQYLLRLQSNGAVVFLRVAEGVPVCELRVAHFECPSNRHGGQRRPESGDVHVDSVRPLYSGLREFCCRELAAGVLAAVR